MGWYLLIAYVWQKKKGAQRLPKVLGENWVVSWETGSLLRTKVKIRLKNLKKFNLDSPHSPKNGQMP